MLWFTSEICRYEDYSFYLLCHFDYQQSNLKSIHTITR